MLGPRGLLAALLCIVALAAASAAQARSSASLHWVVANCKAPSWCGWQATVACENSSRWYDSPGFYVLGLQFDPGTLATAERNTGVRASAWPPSQIVNAMWTRAHSAGDPWPHCPNP